MTRIDRISNPLNKSRGKRGEEAGGEKWRKLMKRKERRDRCQEGWSRRFSTGMIGRGRASEGMVWVDRALWNRNGEKRQASNRSTRKGYRSGEMRRWWRWGKEKKKRREKRKERKRPKGSRNCQWREDRREVGRWERWRRKNRRKRSENMSKRRSSKGLGLAEFRFLSWSTATTGNGAYLLFVPWRL